MATCPSCNTPLNDGARFCRACGTQLTSEPTTASGSDAPTKQPLGPTPAAVSPPGSRLSTARFVVIAAVLLVIIGGLFSVLIVVSHSRHGKHAAVATTPTSTDVGATTDTVAVTEPGATTGSLAAVPSLQVSFGPHSVEVDHRVNIVVTGLSGADISTAELRVDGVSVAPLDQTRSKWVFNWKAPARDGAHSLEVTAEADGVAPLDQSSHITVTLAPLVAQAFARAQQYADAIDQNDIGAVRQIRANAPPDLGGYSDARHHALYYVQDTVVGSVYELRLAYVVQQIAGPNDLDAGQEFTSFFCVTWDVDLGVSGPNLTTRSGALARTIEQRPIPNKVYPSVPGWVSFDSYRSRLDECVY